MQCVAPNAAVRASADPASELQDQLLCGEVFDVLETAGDWAWGQARRDGYVGWAELAALSPELTAPTHRVAVLRTGAFAQPDFKAPTLGFYSLNALLTVEATEGRYARTAQGWFTAEHLRPIGEALEPDPVTVAERFLAAPYQWGGRDSLGLDCSGLVQQALYGCGRACPRDADMQEEALGRPVEAAELRRGDLVFWDGHVAWMLDGARVLHANAHHMAVAVEPLATLTARMRANGAGEPTSYRRI
jgi:cell wall-associated NlpC family hydrolase